MPHVKAKDGVEIYYEVSGQGTPFLFLSETACDGAVWSLYQVPEFARDHRVIALDYRGTGLSGKPPIRYSTEMFTEGRCDSARSSRVGRRRCLRSFHGWQSCAAFGAQSSR